MLHKGSGPAKTLEDCTSNLEPEWPRVAKDKEMIILHDWLYIQPPIQKQH